MAFGSGMAAGAEIGAGLGAVGGSLLGRSGAENARGRARGELAAWRALYQGINPIVQTDVEETYNLGPSAVEDVGASLDPATRAAQEAQATEIAWKVAMARQVQDGGVPYRMDGVFEEGQIITHPTFGLGEVRAILRPDKMEVLFQDGIRVLRCVC